MIVSVFTQQGLFWKGEATLFVARTTNGTLTILPHHQDITADLVIQKVKINSNSHKRELELGHSFFVFKDEELKILTEMCTWKEETIDD